MHWAIGQFPADPCQGMQPHMGDRGDGIGIELREGRIVYTYRNADM